MLYRKIVVLILLLVPTLSFSADYNSDEDCNPDESKTVDRNPAVRPTYSEPTTPSPTVAGPLPFLGTVKTRRDGSRFIHHVPYELNANGTLKESFFAGLKKFYRIPVRNYVSIANEETGQEINHMTDYSSLRTSDDPLVFIVKDSGRPMRRHRIRRTR